MLRTGSIGVLGVILTFSWTVSARGDDWPQWLGPKRDGVWRETGILEKFPAGGLKVRWRTPIGMGYSGPVVAQGKVIVTDRILAEGVSNPASGFSKPKVNGKERIVCLDEATGKILWKHEYDCVYFMGYPAGPRTTPVVAGNKIYTLGAVGDLVCLDIDKGTVIWSKKLAQEYKVPPIMWGFAGHPLVDGDRLICLVGGPGSNAVAFNKDTGKEIWRALTSREPGYAPPMLFDMLGQRRLVVWDPAAINALDPETGKVIWSQPFPGKREIKAGLTIPSPRLDGDRLFITAFYDGPIMLRLKESGNPSVIWRGQGRGEKPDDTDGLHSIMCTPFFKGDYIYGVCSYGELRCLKADTGERLWSTHQATTGKSQRWGNAFIVAQGERFILFNEQGDLISARLTPKGYDEVSRTHILEPTNIMAGRPVVWTHPAFANRNVYARNDQEIICASMAAE